MMKPEREQFIEAMKALDWEARQLEKGKWEFRRKDDKGLYDTFTLHKTRFSPSLATHYAMMYGDADDLLETINEARMEWFKKRFPHLSVE